jgi:3-hydroxyacyl-CoA dehydrogenase/enoyl-CoA hydratase/3-hydroxybutyryl-CoA epimerase
VIDRYRRGAMRDGDATIDIADRLVLAMVNEAARCLDEGVAGAADDIDLAMVLGTGWAPFRGGPLRYARDTGVARIVGDLEELSRSIGAPYEPSSLLRRWLRQGATKTTEQDYHEGNER